MEPCSKIRVPEEAIGKSAPSVWVGTLVYWRQQTMKWPPRTVAGVQNIWPEAAIKAVCVVNGRAGKMWSPED